MTLGTPVGFVRSRRRVAARRAGRSRKPVSVARAVLQFGLTSVAAVFVIGFVGVQVLKTEGSSEAYRDARRLTTLAGRGIVQPVVQAPLLVGNRAAIARLDRVVRSSVLGQGIVRVKVWTAQGRIVYSDASALIGSKYPLTAAERRAMRSGAVVAESGSDPRLPENRFERGQGPLVDVYLPIHPHGVGALLFEAYLPSHEVSATARRRWEAFAPALFTGLGLLALVQLPLAWSLATQLQRRQRERETLLERAIAASENERRRIAGDLHDGVVQDLAGVAYAQAAAAEGSDAGVLKEALRSSAAQTQQCIRSLRSLLVDIYPPNLGRVGLRAALSDLLSGFAARGVSARLECEERLRVGEEDEAVLYRVAQEALRNVLSHAHASSVDVSVADSDGAVTLTVCDDGVGLAEGAVAERSAAGHLGLSLLSDLVREHGGELEIESAPGGGTRVRAEVVPS